MQIERPTLSCYTQHTAGAVLSCESGHISTEGGLSTLTLEPGASSDTDIIYDDVVEAVGASVQHVYRPWTSDHTTFTSLVIGLGMLVISAGWIALSWMK